MARIEVTLLGKTYPVRSADGEEERVMQLAEYAEERLERLATHEQREGNSVSDTRLLMLGCLMLADEVFELKAQRSRLGHPVEEKATKATSAATLDPQVEQTLVAAVEDLAGRLDQLASRLAG